MFWMIILTDRSIVQSSMCQCVNPSICRRLGLLIFQYINRSIINPSVFQHVPRSVGPSICRFFNHPVIQSFNRLTINPLILVNTNLLIQSPVFLLAPGLQSTYSTCLAPGLQSALPLPFQISFCPCVPSPS